MIKKISKKSVFGAVVLLLFISSVVTTVQSATYDWADEDIPCCSKKVNIGTLTSADYDQSTSAQDTAWASFKSTYSGLVDSDRVDNRTYTYNCHSYCFHGSSGWLNDPDNYKGTTTGCWKEDSSGTVKSDSSHSCLVTDNKGKCGSTFLCKNNQHVYSSMPTTVYKKIN